MGTGKKKLAVRIKILIAITCAVIFCLCLFINHFMKQMVSLHMDEYAKAAAAELRGDAELLYSKMESFAQGMIENKNTHAFLMEYKGDDVGLLFGMESKIRQLKALESSILDISFVNERMYYSGIFSEGSLRELQEGMGGRSFAWAGRVMPGEQEMALVYMWNVFGKEGVIGTILLTADASALKRSGGWMEGSYYMLADETGIRYPIHMPEEKEEALLECWQEDTPSEDRVQGQYYMHSYYLQNYNCYLVSILDTDSADMDISGISLLVWMCILVMAASFAMLFVMIDRGFVRPLGEFCRMLREIRNTGGCRLQKAPQFRSCAEMEEISTEFNGMMGDLEQMNRKIFDQATSLYELEIQKKDAELSFLRSQIDPHFFYNTLEAVRHMALARHVPEIAQMAVDMGKIFRYSVKGGDFVRLEEELAIIKSYLQIHRTRFGDKIQAHYFISPDLLSLEMPKMLLQPLVENAVFHGLEPLAGNGRLYIGARKEGKDLVLTVRDDGVGIPGERLLAIQEKLDASTGGILAAGEKPAGINRWEGKEEPASIRRWEGKEEPASINQWETGDVTSGSGAIRRSHVGLRNVHRRVSLYYGKGYGVSVESQEGEGTAVAVRIRISPK